VKRTALLRRSPIVAAAVSAACVALAGCGASHQEKATATASVSSTVRVLQSTAASAKTASTETVTQTQTQTQTQKQTQTQTRSRSTAHERARLPLAGDKVGVDPGHNGRNVDDPTFINHLIWNGREYETCNTTGTETDARYTEAQFNWNVASYLVTDLHREGAIVVLTRHSNDGVGPCVTRRAQIMNDAHVKVAVAIHADGGPADGRGFAILEPVADGINNHALAGSYRFARVLRAHFLSMTGMPESTYDGVDALKLRDDLAGENLTRVPYALIETGNMRNATDAALLTNPSWQRRAAKAICAAITAFLTRS
jgi:N-acetylmuramoyl-L-alanine amidase